MNDKIETGKKFQLTPIKIVSLIALFVLGYFIANWYVAKHYKSKKAAKEVGKVENSDIFDFSDEYKSGVENYDLSDMTVSQMKERGVEFVYQSLLKNQMQINDLKREMQELRAEFFKYKAQEKLGKIIFMYVDFRQKLFSGLQYSEQLKNLEMMIFADEKLQNRIYKMKPLLGDFLTKDKLSKSFSDLIPDLIANKHANNSNKSFLNKLRVYFSKLIVIRKLDDKSNDVDGAIVKVAKFLQEENYQEALKTALLLDGKYHEIMVEFLNKLNVAIEVQKIDQDILNHLKSLS